MGCTFSSVAAQQPAQPRRATWLSPVLLDNSITRHFQSLDQNGKVQVEYVFVDSDFMVDERSFDILSKAMTLDCPPTSLDDLPIWDYGGDDGEDVKLVPRRMYKDPFRGGDNILVFADCYLDPGKGSSEEYAGPTWWNARQACERIMTQAIESGHDPWFGIEQEYYLLDQHTNLPLGWPDATTEPERHETFFCQTGATKAPGRDVAESHYRACLYAGVKIGGINSEEEASQWEFQIGTCSGVEVADDLWMARYLLQRVAELYHVGVTFDPKPVPNRAGIGCHTNYSTTATRKAPGGLAAIKKHVECLRLRHREHMKVYGKGNERRMTGHNHAPSMDHFSYGVADRHASIRIKSKVENQDRGYYEDRRPASSMDPYLVTAILVETTLFYDQAVKRASIVNIDRGDHRSHRNSKKHPPQRLSKVVSPNKMMEKE